MRLGPGGDAGVGGEQALVHRDVVSRQGRVLSLCRLERFIVRSSCGSSDCQPEGLPADSSGKGFNQMSEDVFLFGYLLSGFGVCSEIKVPYAAMKRL